MTIPISKCRKILGKDAESMSNSEIEEISNTFVVISDLAIDSYLDKKRQNIPKNEN